MNEIVKRVKTPDEENVIFFENFLEKVWKLRKKPYLCKTKQQSGGGEMVDTLL